MTNAICAAIRTIAKIAALTLALPAAAQDTPPGDATQGREVGYTCLGCHGIEGQRNAYPSYRVPRLGGQKPDYLFAALRAYRDGTRPHPTMQAQAGSMTDDDIANLVAWIGTWESAEDTVTAADVADLPAAALCVTCHGVAGAAIVPVPPVLSGQQESYLVHALNQYKNGARTGNVMQAFAAALSDADIELLAKFYAAEDGLQTLD